MLERDIEAHLREGVKHLGGWCLKFVTPGFTGVPDRIVIMPGGRIAFVELKRPGQKERQRQTFVQARLRRMGCKVFSAVDGMDRVAGVLSWCEERPTRGRAESASAAKQDADETRGQANGAARGAKKGGGTTSSGPSGHLPLKGKALGGGDEH